MGVCVKSNFLFLKAVQFRQKAERCRALAASFSNSYAKAELEAAAKGWAELAERQAAIEQREASVALR